VRAIKVIGILFLGILIGAFGPRLFFRHVDTSWYNLHTKGKHFGLKYDPSVIFSDLPVPDIRSVTGKAKFMEPVGPGETTEVGYIIVVDMDPLDMSKVPRRYKEETQEKINGVEVTKLAIDRADYEISFDFDLKDKDGFTLKTLHAKSTTELESGTRNVFQAEVDEPIDFAMAIKVHDIWLHPSLDKCFTCLPPLSK
jgi:hypothetical protein